MFGIGLSEFLVIGLVVIVFVRPRDLPVFFRKLGTVYADIRRFYKELVDTKDKLVHDIESAVDVKKNLESPVEKTVSIEASDAARPSESS